MTETISAKRNGGASFGRYLLYRLSSLKLYIIANVIFSAFTFPAWTVVSALRDKAYDVYLTVLNEYELMKSNGGATLEMEEKLSIASDNYTALGNLINTFNIILIIAILALCITCFLITLRTFRHLHNKIYTDMELMLPVSAEKRFAADMLSDYIAALVPFGLACVFCLTAVEADYIRNVALTGLFALFVFINLNTLIVSVCGKRLTAYFMPVLVNFAIVLFTFAVSSFPSGYDLNTIHPSNINLYTLVSNPLLYCSSPLGMVMYYFVSSSGTGYYFFDSAAKGMVYSRVNAFDLSINMLIPFIAVNLVYIALAYLAIKNRRAEKTGSGYVYKSAHFIIHALIVFAVVSWSVVTYVQEVDNYIKWNELEISDWYYNTEAATNLIAGAVIAVICFIVCELIAGTKIRKFGYSVLRFIASAGLGVIICLIAFSAAKNPEVKIPETSDLLGASLNYNLWQDGKNISQDGSYAPNPEAVVELVKKYQQDDKIGAVDENSVCIYVNVRLFQKNGIELFATYKLPIERLEEVQRAAYDSGVHYGGFYSDITNLTGSEESVSGIMTADSLIPYSEIRNKYSNSSEFRNSLNVSFDELVEAVVADLKELTFEEYKNLSHRFCLSAAISAKSGDSSISTYVYIPIYSTSERTLAILKNNGINIDAVLQCR